MDDLPSNGLVIGGPPTGLEKIYDYESGGHHPLHLGGTLHGWYKVIHKLGSGGYANVWFCRETNSSEPRYVALKIIMTGGSNPTCPELRVNRLVEMGIGEEAAARHFCLPLDHFSITGPIGTHHALVYPVLGPRVSRLFKKVGDDDFDMTLGKITTEVTQAMGALHAHDFRPANILARISILDGLIEDELFGLVGRPIQTRVMTVSREKHDLPTSPQSLITGDACVIDFGESFEISNPSADLGIPQVYRAPEYVLDKTIGVDCDLWALACTIFEIRTGRRLFDTFDDDPDEHLCKMAMVLGKLPEPWWSETWEARSHFLVDEVDTYRKVVEKPEPRSIRESEIPGAEIDCLADLLGKLLAYLPEERLGAADALKHRWFTM
ncbi:kinase-like domain-containing protein [Nemania abortiva]|nr:kinase-like domain-containing protein [Nemania abortiva]